MYVSIRAYTVGKDGRVVSVKEVGEERLGGVTKDILLSRLVVKHPVKDEAAIFVALRSGRKKAALDEGS